MNIWIFFSLIVLTASFRAVLGDDQVIHDIIFSNYKDYVEGLVLIRSCIFRSISHQKGYGGPFSIKSYNGQVDLNKSLIMDCFSNDGSGGGLIICSKAIIYGNCFLRCYTSLYMRIQSLELNTKSGFVESIQVYECGPFDVISGKISIQMRCTLRDFRVNEMNMTYNVQHGAGCVLRIIGSQYCSTIYSNFVFNFGNSSALYGEGTSHECLKTFSSNYLNNSVKNILKFDEGQERQIDNLVFIDNDYETFFQLGNHNTLTFYNCFFDVSEEEVGVYQYSNCSFNQSSYHTIKAECEGIKQCFLEITSPLPTTSENIQLGYKIAIIISICLFIGLCISIFIIIYMKKNNPKPNSKELFFTDEYFRSFVNELQ